MNHIEFIEKNVREILIKQGFSSSAVQGGAWQAIDLYKRMSQASKKGAIFDDVMRHAKAWADKQVSKTEITKSKRNQPKNQGGLF
ncbi:hypothetical protein [Citrobacter freundii]|uniref:hypothetical protein n=1 Tax=Citrobacter freundii TaxID=546 RepID=UPI00374E8742